MKLLLLITSITLSLFLSERAFAQAESKLGYYVNNEGDTLTRRIEYSSNYTTAKSIKVSASATADFYELDIEEVKAFGFRGLESYERQSTLIDRTTKETSDLISDRKYSVTVETVFLEKLVEGPISLSLYTDAYQGNQFFYQKGDEQMKPLTQRIYIDDETQVRENREYLTTLKNILDCSSIKQEDFENIKYNRADITALVYRHNKCVDPNSPRPYKYRKSFISNISVGGGIVRNRIEYRGNFKTSDASYSTDSPLNSYGYQIHAQFESIPQINKRNISLIAEPTISIYSANNLDEEPSFVNELTVDFISLQLPIGLRYIPIQKSKFRAFISGGLTPTLISFNKVIIRTGEVKQNKLNFQFFAGAGLALGKLSSEIRFNTLGGNVFYEFNPNFGTNYYLYQSRTELLLRYQLF